IPRAVQIQTRLTNVGEADGVDVSDLAEQFRVALVARLGLAGHSQPARQSSVVIPDAELLGDSHILHELSLVRPVPYVQRVAAFRRPVAGVVHTVTHAAGGEAD